MKQRRDYMKPYTRYLPKWILFILLFSLTPLYIVVGALSGIKEALTFSWMSQFREIILLESVKEYRERKNGT